MIRNTFTKVFDRRGVRVRGLWERNGHYYTQKSIAGKKRRFRLEGATTVPQAIAAMHAFCPTSVPPNKNTFGEVAAAYIKTINHKSIHTVASEKQNLKHLLKAFGKKPIADIKPTDYEQYQAERIRNGDSAGYVNVATNVFRNVLKFAKNSQALDTIPMTKHISYTPKPKALITSQQLNALCEAAPSQQLADLLRVCAYSGARISEARTLKWNNVHWDREQLEIWSTKTQAIRYVDFNGSLKNILVDMAKRRVPDSDYIFPSPKLDHSPIINIRLALAIARARVGLPHFSFHHCRHFFASMCVMAGIDYMTIARWLGHSDGGVLIGKIYGHLNAEHTKRQAQKLLF